MRQSCILSLFLVIAGIDDESERTFRVGTVINVYTGDTFQLQAENEKLCALRLFGIDAPEDGQPYCREATKRLGQLINGKSVFLVTKGVQAGTLINVWVYRDEIEAQQGDESKSVNYQLVNEGWAWHYKFYLDSKTLADAENAARDDNRGLWQEESPIPPWERRTTTHDTVFIASIGKHLDQLEQITNWVVIIAIITAWSSYRKRNELEILGLQIDSKRVAVVVICLYVAVNTYGIFLMWRLRDLLLWVRDEQFMTALTTLGSHTWVCNPFAIGSNRFSYSGIAFLALAWWICTASVTLAYKSAHPDSRRLAPWLIGIFFLTGIFAFHAIMRVHVICRHRGLATGSFIVSGVYFNISWLIAFGATGFILGFIAFALLLHRQTKGLARRSSSR